MRARFPHVWVKAGISRHNLKRKKGETEMRVKSKVKAGGGDGWANHNQSVKGLRVKSNVKAGELKSFDPGPVIF
jgi:hypothetical protein